GCAIAPDPKTGLPTVSVYRRPLPTTNLRFLSAVMWDGRETIGTLAGSSTFKANLFQDLAQQATDAVLGHAQGTAPPTSAQLSSIVNFELGLTSAQVFDFSVGSLDSDGARGGPQALATQPYF